MPSIANGGNATGTLGYQDSVSIDAGGGYARFECPTGTIIAEFRGSRTFGPYTNASFRVTSLQGAIYYETADGHSANPVTADEFGNLYANGSSVSGAGKVPVVTRDISVHDLMLAEPLMQLDLPSPYFASGASTTKEHAYGTPIYFPNGWNGYKFWMVGAPYPTQGGTALAPYKYENPTIYVSNDGENFVSPPGIQSSPIFTSIGLSDTNSYYADPYIVAAPDGSKLYVLWCWFSRSGATKSSFLVSESTDGLTWSTPVEILPSTSTTFTPNTPSLLWNGNGWTIMAIDTATGTYNPITTRTTSSTPYSGWAAPSTVFNGAWSAVTATHPLSRQWWHGYWTMCANSIVGLVADNGSAGGNAYSWHSSDGGLTFSVQPFSAQNPSAGGTWYRPGLCVCNDGANQTLLMYASRISPMQQAAAGGYYMQKARVMTGRSADWALRAFQRDAVNRQLSASSLRQSGLLLFDSFNRADSALTLGSADSGQAWTVAAGTWGISTNRAYNPVTTNCIAVLDTGTTNYDFEVQVQTAGANFNVLWDYVDSSNFARFGTANSGWQRIVGGGISAASPMIALASGDIFRVSKRGARVTLYINDRPIDSLYDTTFAGSTKIGLQASSATPTYFENVIVRAA